jgi:hypothetical protein
LNLRQIQNGAVFERAQTTGALECATHSKQTQNSYTWMEALYLGSLRPAARGSVGAWSALGGRAAK